MSFAVTIKPSYLTDMLTLPREVSKRLEHVVEELQRDPTPRGATVKKLKGYVNVYRYRINDHRLVYAVDLTGKVIKLLAIGLRKTIYDRFRSAPEVPLQPIPGEVAEHPDRTEPDASEEADAHIAPPQVDERTVPGDSSGAGPAAEPLPPIKEDLLRTLRVPEEHFPDLVRCRTDVDLFAAPVPDTWKGRVLDALFPKPIAQVQTQPDLVLQTPEDLTKFVEGTLTAFLLQLDAEQEALAKRSLIGPALIKGGPGTGKSTVALYRARALVEQGAVGGRPPSILFTTYTNALVSASEQLLQSLLGPLPHELSVKTVDGLGAMVLRDADGRRHEAARPEDCREAIAASRGAGAAAAPAKDLQAFLASATSAELPPEFLLDEIDWVIEGRGIDTLEAYLGADRSGRGIKLTPPTRRKVWEIYTRYRDHLAKQGLSTWGGMRSLALDAVRSGRFAQRWDYVIVDEAQDLTPVALRLCVELCRTPQGLFLAADAGQSIYNRGFAWSQVHDSLQLRGRTRILRRNYRTTLQLSRATANLLAGRGTSDPETVPLEAVREGTKPVVKACVDRLAQYQWLAARIQETARTLQLSPSVAALLCPTKAVAQEAADALKKAGLNARFMEGRALRLDGNEVKVLTMHSAKGLEFPIVGIPAVEEGLVPLPTDPRDDVRAHEDEQRRLLYVAMTRAMRQLFVATTRGRASPFLRDLSAEHWDLRLGE